MEIKLAKIKYTHEFIDSQKGALFLQYAPGARSYISLKRIHA